MNKNETFTNTSPPCNPKFCFDPKGFNDLFNRGKLSWYNFKTYGVTECEPYSNPITAKSSEFSTQKLYNPLKGTDINKNQITYKDMYDTYNPGEKQYLMYTCQN